MDLMNLLCCTDTELGCYQSPCNPETRKPKDYFNAVAFVEGLVIPKVGNTVTINSVSVILTEQNFPLNLIAWMREVQYKCGVDNNGVVTKGKITFFEYNSIKGTRPRTAKKLANALFDGTIPPPVGIEGTTMYGLADCYANQSWLDSMLYSKKKLSIINFADTALEVLRQNDGYKIVPNDGGLDWKGDNKQIEGALEVKHEGRRDYVLHLVAENDIDAYKEELNKATEFSFDRNLIVVTGMIPLACGKNSECLQYQVITGLPFSFLSDKDQESTCTNWTLYSDCNSPLDPTLPILIDSQTGKVSSTGFTKLGNYKFTVAVQNECCIFKSYCIEITVQPVPVPVA